MIFDGIMAFDFVVRPCYLGEYCMASKLVSLNALCTIKFYLWLKSAISQTS